MRGRGDVGVPAEPSGVTSIEVEVDVGLAELLDSIYGHALVDVLSSGATRIAQVGDQVGEGSHSSHAEQCKFLFKHRCR